MSCCSISSEYSSFWIFAFNWSKIGSLECSSSIWFVLRSFWVKLVISSRTFSDMASIWMTVSATLSLAFDCLFLSQLCSSVSYQYLIYVGQIYRGIPLRELLFVLFHAVVALSPSSQSYWKTFAEILHFAVDWDYLLLASFAVLWEFFFVLAYGTLRPLDFRVLETNIPGIGHYTCWP